MRLLAACLLLVVPAGLASGRDTDDWIDFSPKGGKFTIKVPTKPKEQTQDVDTAVGPITLHLFTVPAGKDGAYLVAYADLPEDALDPDNLDESFDGLEKGFIKGAKWKQLSSKKIKLQKKYPGREITFSVPQLKAKGKARFFVVQTRLYQIVAVGTEEFMEGEDIDFFFDSFRITK